MSQYSWQLPDPRTQPEFYQDVNAKRVFAWLVDTIAIVLLCLLIVPFTAFTALFFFPLLVLVVGFGYRVVTLANGSATWGMRLFAVELRKADGEKLDFGTAFLHTLGLTVSFAMPLLQLISVVLMATSDRNQGLSDHLLGTVAINRSARH
ncbi:MAG: RDD family protein [Thalassovita sp.]